MENIHQVTERLMAGANVVVVPTVWHKTVLKNDKPYFPAMWMLAQIVYWHRLNAKGAKRFKADMLQLKNEYWTEELGLTYKQVKDAKKVLKDLGVVVTHTKTVTTNRGRKLGNVCFLELVPTALEALFSPAVPTGTEPLVPTGTEPLVPTGTEQSTETTKYKDCLVQSSTKLSKEISNSPAAPSSSVEKIKDKKDLALLKAVQVPGGVKDIQEYSDSRFGVAVKQMLSTRLMQLGFESDADDYNTPFFNKYFNEQLQFHSMRGSSAGEALGRISGFIAQYLTVEDLHYRYGLCSIAEALMVDTNAYDTSTDKHIHNLIVKLQSASIGKDLSYPYSAFATYVIDYLSEKETADIANLKGFLTKAVPAFLAKHSAIDAAKGPRTTELMREWLKTRLANVKRRVAQ